MIYYNGEYVVQIVLNAKGKSSHSLLIIFLIFAVFG